MSKFRILPAPNHGRLNGVSHGAAGVDDLGSNQSGLEQLKEKFVFQWFRVTDDNYKGPERIGAEMSRDGQSDGQPKAFRPDDRQKRSEFSLHIGS